MEWTIWDWRWSARRLPAPSVAGGERDQDRDLACHGLGPQVALEGPPPGGLDPAAVAAHAAWISSGRGFGADAFRQAVASRSEPGCVILIISDFARPAGVAAVAFVPGMKRAGQ